MVTFLLIKLSIFHMLAISWVFIYPLVLWAYNWDWALDIWPTRISARNEPDDRKWRILCMCPPGEQNLRDERLTSHKCVTYREQKLIPDQWASAKNLSPFSSQWTYCLGSGWTSPSLFSLPINAAHLNPSMDTPAACYSLWFSIAVSLLFPSKLHFW